MPEDLIEKVFRLFLFHETSVFCYPPEMMTGESREYVSFIEIIGE